VAYVDQVGSPDSDIYTVSPATGEVRQLTMAGGYELAPIWSPDGRMIAYINETDSTVYVMNADGSGQRLIARDSQDVAWSSDGTALVIGHPNTREREGELDVVTRQGTTLKKLTTGNLFVFSMSWAPADEIAYVQDNGDQNQDKCGS
jgi:TolB protein